MNVYTASNYQLAFLLSKEILLDVCEEAGLSYQRRALVHGVSVRWTVSMRASERERFKVQLLVWRSSQASY